MGGGEWPVAVRGRGMRTGLGWSGRAGGWSAGGFEEAEPLGLTVPAVGQVQGEVPAAVAGGAGGDVDEMAAQVTQAALAGNAPEGRWARGPSVRSAKTCSTRACSLN